MKQFFLNITGLVPILSSNYGLLGQILKSRKTRNMTGFSWSLLTTFVITASCCLAHEVLLQAWWLALKDALALSCAVTLLVMKIRFNNRNNGNRGETA